MSSEIHEGVKCDSCGKENITGIRYKCMECPNYDICESCMAKPREQTSFAREPNGSQPEGRSASNDTAPPYTAFPYSRGVEGHTNDHMLLKVSKWSQTKKCPLLFNRDQWVNKGIQCFHCNKQNIIGWRYLCVQCGINICEVCERTGEHTLSHPLLKMVPIQEPISNVPGITFIQPTQSLFSGVSAQPTPQQPAQSLFSGFTAQPAAQQQTTSPFGFTQPAAQQQTTSPFGFTQPAAQQQTTQQSLFGFTQPAAQQQTTQQSLFGFNNATQQSPFGFNNANALQFGAGAQNAFGKK